MLRWLDSNSNRKAQPNENFARELMELFSLGVGNYTEDDVRESARAFTGWRVDTSSSRDNSIHDTGTFIYYKQWHDRFNKQVLGRYLPADQGDMEDGRQVFDILAAHPGTDIRSTGPYGTGTLATLTRTPMLVSSAALSLSKARRYSKASSLTKA